MALCNPFSCFEIVVLCFMHTEVGVLVPEYVCAGACVFLSMIGCLLGYFSICLCDGGLAACSCKH